MKRSLRVISLIAFAAAGHLHAAQEHTLTGMLSDSMCKLHHESGAEGQETTDPDCTRDCVKGGSKYVLVVDDKVYTIVNQDQAQLPEHAGTQVVVRGAVRGDLIEVAAVEKAR